MRFAPAFAVLTLVTACSFGGDTTPQPVDAANLPPLSGQEQALLVGAESAVRQGNLAAAEKDYMSAVAVSTGHIEAHVALAKLYASTQQVEKERAVLERAQALQPNNPGVNYLLGKVELAAGHNEAALTDFTQGLATVPGDLDLSTGAGIANDMLGHHRAAQALYQKAIAHHKGENLAGVKTNLGMSYLFTNEPKKTIALLKDEAKKPHASSVTKYNLALAYGLLGETLNAQFVLKGEGDEAARVATVARLKNYIADQRADKTPADVNPVLAPQPAR